MARPALRGPETAAAVAAVLANPPSSIRDPILTGRPRDTATPPAAGTVNQKR